eukprot:2008628-Amphidinium_carterae.1
MQSQIRVPHASMGAGPCNTCVQIGPMSQQQRGTLCDMFFASVLYSGSPNECLRNAASIVQ